MEYFWEEMQICQEQTEETIVRGVDSSAIVWAKNDIEYEDNQRNNQHREFYKAG
jgi:hypothetical protein